LSTRGLFVAEPPYEVALFVADGTGRVVREFKLDSDGIGLRLKVSLVHAINVCESSFTADGLTLAERAGCGKTTKSKREFEEEAKRGKLYEVYERRG